MRASDADRQRAIRRLSVGYATGQLGAEIFAHRVDLAYRAGARADLYELTADLSGGRLRDAYARLLEALSFFEPAAAHPQPPSLWLMPPASEEGPWVIGRDPECHLVITDMTVSRRHAELRWTPEGYALSDLNSTNGCYANGSRVHWVLLRPDDDVVLGQVRVRLAQRP